MSDNISVSKVDGLWVAKDSEGNIVGTAGPDDLNALLSADRSDTLTSDFATNVSAQEEIGELASIGATTVNADSKLVQASDMVKYVWSEIGRLREVGVEVDETLIFPAPTAEVELNPALLEALKSNPAQRAIFERNMSVGEIGTFEQALAASNAVKVLIADNLDTLIADASERGYTKGYSVASAEFDTIEYSADSVAAVIASAREALTLESINNLSVEGYEALDRDLSALGIISETLGVDELGELAESLSDKLEGFEYPEYDEEEEEDEYEDDYDL